eukprot:6030164-Amphidinium_carterae.1
MDGKRLGNPAEETNIYHAYCPELKCGAWLCPQVACASLMFEVYVKGFFDCMEEDEHFYYFRFLAE